MITWDETAQLLAFCATFDNRIGDELDIQAWMMVGQLQGWTFESARRVIVEHYAKGVDRPRITPAAISDRLRGIRNAAAATFEAPVLPVDEHGEEVYPDGLTYPEWYRARQTEHVERCLASWSETGQEPKSLPVAPSRIASVRQLAARAPQHIRGELDAANRRFEERRP